MRVLAIDSSGLTASAAIVEEDQTIVEYTTNFKKTHSQTLLPMIDEMTRMVDIDLASIDAIAISGGPGSFTGLRIGSATAKGLGLALDKPLIHVPTLEAMAYSIYGCEDIICPIMDARRSQVYTGLYTFVPKKEERETLFDERSFQIMRVQMAVSVEELIRHLNVYRRRVVFLGDGVPIYREMLEKGLKVPYAFAPPFANRQRAAAVGALGIRYYRQGKFETAAEHKPEYLRVSQAERERARREKDAVPQVRRMVREDGAAVAEMEHQLFSDAWSEKSVLETLEQEKTICLLAEKAGRTAGYLLAYTAADEAEIARVAVVKELQRQGVARALLAELESICRTGGIRKILLDVRCSNSSARALYERAGYREDGIRQRFYENPQEDAILMSRDVTDWKIPHSDGSGSH
nr:tRNA (adenosine(37)-N6)-threonylcarbamoyltransferase complex dimerization subunit type 1 TsaB [uncultured Mediterraneibacter sp.]